MTNNVSLMTNLKLSSKQHLRRNHQSASQSTFASQTSKCVSIDKCVAKVKVRRNRHLCAKCVAFPTSLRRNRQIRRKRQSASQSTNASQTSKCVAIDNCRLAKRRICVNCHFCPNRRLCRNVYLHITAPRLQHFSVRDSREKLHRIAGG
jgi:hypothetical protein